MQDYLCVGLRTEPVAQGFQFGAQLAIVVDFPVVGQQKPMIGADHRLMPGRGQVDDGQPSMPQPDIALNPMSFAIRSAMHDRVGHALQYLGRDGAAVEIDQASDAAHQI